MKEASIITIRKELPHLSHAELISACLRLGKYSKENKQLLTYLIFESQDESAYIQKVKDYLIDDFDSLDQRRRKSIIKGVRRILKEVKKYAKFSQKKETEIELTIWFCKELKLTLREIYFNDYVIDSLYERQILRIQNLIKGLHEDLQYDYKIALEELEVV